MPRQPCAEGRITTTERTVRVSHSSVNVEAAYLLCRDLCFCKVYSGGRCGVFGSLLSPWLSDKNFTGKRNTPTCTWELVCQHFSWCFPHWPWRTLCTAFSRFQSPSSTGNLENDATNACSHAGKHQCFQSVLSSPHMRLRCLNSSHWDMAFAGHNSEGA